MTCVGAPELVSTRQMTRRLPSRVAASLIASVAPAVRRAATLAPSCSFATAVTPPAVVFVNVVVEAGAPR